MVERLSIAVFAFLIRVYPRAFRLAHQTELVEFLRSQIADARNQTDRSSTTAVAEVWRDTIADLVRTTWRLRFRPRVIRLPGEPEFLHEKGRIMSGLSHSLKGAARASLRGSMRGWRALAASAATLALGIAATTAVYSLVDGVLLKRLPYPNADRLVSVGTLLSFSPDHVGPMSVGHLHELREGVSGLSAVVASGSASLTLTGEAEPRTLQGLRVTDDYFDVLGAVPILGRTLGAEDTRAGAERTLVLSELGWQEEFGGRRDIVGQEIRLNNTTYTVVGVISRSFEDPAQLGRSTTRVYLPMSLAIDDNSYSQFSLQAVGLLAEGRSMASVDEEVKSLLARITAEKHPRFPVGGELSALRTQVLGSSIERTLVLALIGVGVLLVISCANVAHLLLLRGLDRHREFAVRQALGASRGQLVTQLVGEGIVVGIVGGVMGAAVAYLGVRAFVALGPGGIPRLGSVAVDERVLGVSMAVAIVSAAIAAWIPAHVATRVDPIRALREGGRSLTASRTRRRMQAALAVGSVACATMLVLCAGLFGRSFGTLASVDPGFEPNGLATVKVSLRSGQAPEWRSFFNELNDRIATMPGVTHVGMSSSMPFTGDGIGSRLWVPSWQPGDPRPDFLAYTYIGGDYFETMEIPVIEGRTFTADDRLNTENVVIVDQTWVRKFMPEATSVIGTQLRSGEPDDADSDTMTIVGVVAGIRGQLWQEPQATVYVPMAQQMWRAINVVARVDGDPGSLLPAMRQAVWNLDANLPVNRSAVVTDLRAASIAEERFYAGLIAVFSVVGLMLAIGGVYGAVSNTVRMMARDIGVRMALGAAPGRMRSLVILTGIRPALIGIAIGVMGVLWAGRLLATHLFEVEPTDPITLAGVPVLLVLAALVACVAPAVRAGRTDPASILTEH